MKILRAMGEWIDAFRPAEGAPPQTLGAFFRWCLRGTWGQLWLSSILSAMAGITEVVSALILGWVVDAAASSTPGTFLALHGSFILWASVFYIVFRPLIFAVSSASGSCPGTRVGECKRQSAP